ncbi:Uncharacterised protein [Ectopseudomonas mendocina]|jgi:hypothetical protein|uniref:Uncharacterized protein n=1 Tax=Ectopseudomonas mendocina TaxID=300 RepID=A0A379IN24_ECTME|nr:Uncharacterised protein [Pseudomonas mendocina]
MTDVPLDFRAARHPVVEAYFEFWIRNKCSIGELFR